MCGVWALNLHTHSHRKGDQHHINTLAEVWSLLPCSLRWVFYENISDCRSKIFTRLMPFLMITQHRQKHWRPKSAANTQPQQQTPYNPFFQDNQAETVSQTIKRLNPHYHHYIRFAGHPQVSKNWKLFCWTHKSNCELLLSDIISTIIIILLRKETAFPRCRAMDRRWNRTTVSLVSWVMTVVRMPISWTSSIAMSSHMPAVSTAMG